MGPPAPGTTSAKEDLWRIYETLLGEIAERRARAGVMVLADIGVLAALVAFAFVDAQLADSSQAVHIAFLAIVIFQGITTILAYVAVNPGLPWERRPFVHSIAWRAARVVGAGLDPVTADQFDPLYRQRSIAWSRFRRAMRRDEHDPVRIQRVVEGVDAEALAISVVAVVYEIDQQRSWRRLVAISSLTGASLSGCALLVALAGVLHTTVEDVAGAALLAVAGLMVVVILVRAIRTDGGVVS